MGALNPLFLLAAVAVGVPLFLHLFQRHRARRLSFPALRYLERTEREHARRIRFRQLLLLLLRVTILLLVVFAGARIFLRGAGSAHPPTALAVVLDNSASSGRVVGERRVLDELKERALATLARATPEDRIWILRAGEPWSPAAPLTAEEARRRVEETEVSAAAADLAAEVERAGELVATAGLQAREVHLLSDLQASSVPEGDPVLPAELPLVVWRPAPPAEANRGLTEVEIGGGLPPLAGQRTQVTVATRAGSDSVEVGVRLVVAGRIRGAATVPAGAAASIPLPATPAGWVTGAVEADPDALRADDRRAFAFRARPAPTVELRGETGPFVEEAAAVLREAGRLAGGGSAADLLVAGGGEDATSGTGAVLVLPPSDPALLPALNRRLADAGIPWRYGRGPAEGAAPLEGDDLPEPLEDVTVHRRYALTLEGTPVGPPRILGRVAGEPWLAEGSVASGRRYLLVGSALDEASSSLPVSAEMVRFLDWAAGSWAAVGGGPVERPAGEPLPAPRGADRVLLPDGTLVPVDATRTVRNTGQAGFYTFLDADSSVVSVQAVNPPASESDLTPVATGSLGARLGGEVTEVTRAERWDSAIFQARRGSELWLPLLAAALLLLLTESLVAAAGRSRQARPGPQRSPAPPA